VSATSRPRRVWRAHEEAVSSLSIIGPPHVKGGSVCLSTSADGSTKAWTATGESLGQLEHEHKILEDSDASAAEEGTGWKVPVDLSGWEASERKRKSEMRRKAAIYIPPESIASAPTDLELHLLDEFTTDKRGQLLTMGHAALAARTTRSFAEQMAAKRCSDAPKRPARFTESLPPGLARLSANSLVGVPPQTPPSSQAPQQMSVLEFVESAES
jgi:hypothetical protein